MPLTKKALTPQKQAMDLVKEYFKIECSEKREIRSEASKELTKYLFRTEDGSYTLQSNEFDGKTENMHTSHGAITESLEKFVKPSELENKKNIKVLDICCGLGYNAAALIEYLDPITNTDIKLELDMVEISPETLAAGLLIPSPIKSHHIIQKAYENELIEKKFACLPLIQKQIPANIHFNVFIQDARDLVVNLKDDDYDAIFLDPFSPSKSPELYSIEFLSELKRIIKSDGILSTYTSAAPVRSGLVESGFHIGEGPTFGRKSGGTTASLSLKKIERDISINDERMIALSDAGIPFRDPDLNLSAEEIINNRSDERKNSRGKYKFSSTVKTPIFLGKELENDRTWRRITKNMNKLNIDDPQSKKALYLICCQYNSCICGCGEPRILNSRDRILKMATRLKEMCIC